MIAELILLCAVSVLPSDRLAMADRLFNRGQYADAEKEYRALSGEKGIEMFVQKFYVHGTESLEIIFSILVLRGLLPVDEIVVELYDFRVESEYAALLSNA